jgi:dUTP pyrophosphatase
MVGKAMMAGLAQFAKTNPDAVVPTWGTEESACCDLYLSEEAHLPPLSNTWGRTDLIAIPPDGWHWVIHPRSSLSIHYPGVILWNMEGIIDSDYQGPEDIINIPLRNTHPHDEYLIPKGTRVAQMELVRNVRAIFEEIPYEQILNRQSRGGFGSTGR